jgi:hypothetical protein
MAIYWTPDEIDEEVGACGVCGALSASAFCSDLCYRLAFPGVTIYTQGEVWRVPLEVWEAAPPPVGVSNADFTLWLETHGDYEGHTIKRHTRP